MTDRVVKWTHAAPCPPLYFLPDHSPVPPGLAAPKPALLPAQGDAEGCGCSDCGLLGTVTIMFSLGEHGFYSILPHCLETQKAINVCEGKQEMGDAGRVWEASLPREIGLACQVAKIRAVTVLHALVPVTVSTVGPVTV